MNRKVLIFLIVASALLLQACGPDAQALIATGIYQTQQISELQTAAAGGGQPQSQTTPQGDSSAEDAAAATPSDTPTITLTPTSSVAMVSVNQNTNCRSGPSVNYGLITTINVGQQVEVLKSSTFSDYVVIRNPNGSGDCWLWLRYADKTDFTAYSLPVATQPPTPTPTYTPTPSFDWAGNWNIKLTDGATTYTGTQSCTVSGNNVTCSATVNPGGLALTFSGSMNASRQQASGTYTGPTSGGWAAQIKSGNLNQFIGNISPSGAAYCGARSGSSLPDPCLWP